MDVEDPIKIPKNRYKRPHETTQGLYIGTPGLYVGTPGFLYLCSGTFIYRFFGATGRCSIIYILCGRFDVAHFFNVRRATRKIYKTKMSDIKSLHKTTKPLLSDVQSPYIKLKTNIQLLY
jgi:hypothetical protein